MKFSLTFKDPHREFRIGAYLMLLSSVFLSLFSLFGKIAVKDTPFFLLTFLRFFIPFVIMLPYFFWTLTLRELTGLRHFMMQLLRAACMLVYQYAIFYYLLHSSLLNVTVLQNTFPLFLPILERIFFKHRFNAKEILSIVVCFLGVLCILQPHRGIFASLSIVAVIAPLAQAGSQVLYAHAAKEESQKTAIFYLYFLCSIVAGIIFLFSSDHPEGLPALENYTIFAWANIIALGATSVVNQVTRGFAYVHAKPSQLTPFLYVSLIFSAFLDWAIYNHLPNMLSVAGALLVLGGGVLQMYGKK